MGDMISYFSCADVVFMGGTLVPTGGHNILEPAAVGLPIVYGPHMFNFKSINELFLKNHAAIQVDEPEALKPALKQLLSDTEYAGQMAHNAQLLIQKNAGAVDKMLQCIMPIIKK